MNQNENTLYDQLLRLRKLPNAFSEWTAYRCRLTDFILENAEKGSSLLVMGAGGCNDLDLTRLSSYFSKVILSDCDEAAMREGIKKQNIPPMEIEIQITDYLGIEPSDYRSLCGQIEQQIRLRSENSEILKRTLPYLFLERMQEIVQAHRKFCRKNIMTDYIVCCGVHSQLNNLFPQMAEVYHRYVDFDLQPIYQKASALNRILAEDLNGWILSNSGKGAFLGLERKRNGMESPIEGAYQAIEDLSDRKVKIRAEKLLEWPFYQKENKVYEMQLIAVNS